MSRRSRVIIGMALAAAGVALLALTHLTRPSSKAGPATIWPFNVECCCCKCSPTERVIHTLRRPRTGRLALAGTAGAMAIAGMLVVVLRR